MAQKMSATTLKRELAAKSKAQLIDEIAILFKKFDIVNDYYTVSLIADDVSVLTRYKQKVNHEFVPSIEFENPPLRLAKARKAITEFRKITTNRIDIADIMLSYLESGNECTSLYGGLYESFYSSMESMFGSALKFIYKEGLVEENQARIEKIIENADGGWCFRDSLIAIYSDYNDN